MGGRSHPRPGPAAHRWGPDRRLRWVCLAVAVGCVAWRLVDRDPENRLVAVVLAVAALAGALVLLRVKVRLAADSHGLTIVGPLHARTVTWSSVRAITTPRRGRFGRRRASLEIEVAGDPSDEVDGVDGGYDGYDGAPGMGAPGDAEPDTVLYAFGAFELGGDPAAAGAALRRLRG